jgi:hypothetical protein
VIELILMDERGSTSAVVVNIPSSTPISEADASALALASVVAPMSDAVLVRYRVSWRVVADEPGIAENGAAIKNAGVFIYRNFTDTDYTIVSIPAIKDSLVLSTGFTAGVGIDTSADEVFELGEQLLDMNACNPFGEFVWALKSAYKQSRV